MNQDTFKGVLLVFSFFLLAVLLILAAVAGVNHALGQPFNAVNQALHARGASVNLDFLIPGRFYIDDQMTIGQVIAKNFEQKKGLWVRLFDATIGLIPRPWLIGFNVFIFFFFMMLFMIFFRLFTLMRYSRCLGLSLLCAGLIYFYLPDFNPGRADDAVALGGPVLVLLLGWGLSRRRKRRGRWLGQSTYRA